MEEPRIRNEGTLLLDPLSSCSSKDFDVNFQSVEIEKGVDKFSKGKLEHEEEKRVIHILEETEGKDDTANADTERKDESSKTDSPKKTKKITNQKTNVTVPRPFNLATENRMMRERKGSMDFKESKPILISKSASFNHKTSQLGGNGSLSMRKSLQPKVRSNEKDDKKTEGDKTKNMPKEKTTFKALPLPKFYLQKDCPPKSEAKKMVIERSKPPMIGDQVKKTLRKSDNKKTEGNAIAKSVSKGIGGGAKETISKVVKQTKKKSLTITPKETIKDLV